MRKLAWPWHTNDAAGPGPARSRSDRLPRLDLHGATLRRVDLSNTDLEGADFTDTDFTGANLRGVNLRNAKLKGAVLRGADLREAENLTWEQLSEAVIDETTTLPGDLAAPAGQPRSEAGRPGEAS
jgi:uncharacterized protein YjbI with pentapeptide repeats